jgi:hypothetical protein
MVEYQPCPCCSPFVKGGSETRTGRCPGQGSCTCGVRRNIVGLAGNPLSGHTVPLRGRCWGHGDSLRRVERPSKSAQRTHVAGSAPLGHCQVIGDDSVTRQQQGLSGLGGTRRQTTDTVVVGSVGQSGHTRTKALGVCPADLNPCMRYSRCRVGRCEFSQRLLR